VLCQTLWKITPSLTCYSFAAHWATETYCTFFATSKPPVSGAKRVRLEQDFESSKFVVGNSLQATVIVLTPSKYAKNIYIFVSNVLFQKYNLTKSSNLERTLLYKAIQFSEIKKGQENGFLLSPWKKIHGRTLRVQYVVSLHREAVNLWYTPSGELSTLAPLKVKVGEQTLTNAGAVLEKSKYFHNLNLLWRFCRKDWNSE